MIPAHAQRTLDDIRCIRQRLDDAEAAILAVYDHRAPADPPVDPPVDDEQEPEIDPPPLVEPPPSVRRARLEAPRPAPVSKSPATARGKYDTGILRALHSEQAQFGMSGSDVCRTFTGPGKPDEVARISGPVTMALQSLQRRGQVRKDGRMWHVVRQHEREAVSA